MTSVRAMLIPRSFWKFAIFFFFAITELHMHPQTLLFSLCSRQYLQSHPALPALHPHLQMMGREVSGWRLKGRLAAEVNAGADGGRAAPSKRARIGSAVLLKICTPGAGDAVAFYCRVFFFARGTLLCCPGWASAPLSTPACFCSFVWRCSLPPLGCLKLVWTKYRTEEQARRGRGME